MAIEGGGGTLTNTRRKTGYGPAGWSTGYYKEVKAINRLSETRANTKTKAMD